MEAYSEIARLVEDLINGQKSVIVTDNMSIWLEGRRVNICYGDVITNYDLRVTDTLFAVLRDKYNWEYPLYVQEDMEDGHLYITAGTGEIDVCERHTYVYSMRTGNIVGQWSMPVDGED